MGGRVDGELVATLNAYDPATDLWTIKANHPYNELYGFVFNAITLTKVFLNGSPRLEMLSGTPYATNWAYIP